MMIETPNPALQTQMHLMALCRDCQKYHEIETSAAYLVNEVDRWHQKHVGHDIEFVSNYRKVPRDLNDKIFQETNQTPWYLEEGWSENADLKLAYAASAAYTITLASLATSSTHLVGRQSTVVSNTTNLFLDYGIAGRVMVGTGPTANTSIQAMVFGSLNDTPLYPDAFGGTDAARTIASEGVKGGAVAFIAYISVGTTTSDREYPFLPVSLSLAMGGFLPKSHGVFVAHNTGVNLNSTGGNHGVFHTGVYRTI